MLARSDPSVQLTSCTEFADGPGFTRRLQKEQPKLLGEALEATKAAHELYRNTGITQYEAYFADRIEALEAAIATLRER